MSFRKGADPPPGIQVPFEGNINRNPLIWLEIIVIKQISEQFHDLLIAKRALNLDMPLNKIYYLHNDP